MFFLLLLLSWQVACRWSNQALHDAHLKIDNMLKEKEAELVARAYRQHMERAKDSHGYSKDSCDKGKGFGKVRAKSDKASSSSSTGTSTDSGQGRSRPYPSTTASMDCESSWLYPEPEAEELTK